MSLGLDYQIKDGVISVIQVDAGGPADKVGIKPGMQALIAKFVHECLCVCGCGCVCSV
jgi:hypothetical protein